MWAALSFLTQLPKTSRLDLPRTCAIRVVRVSGTVKKAEEEAVRRARAAILRAKRESGEGGVDGLVGLLGSGDDDDDGGLLGGGNVTAGSDISDEDGVGMESEGDG